MMEFLRKIFILLFCLLILVLQGCAISDQAMHTMHAVFLKKNIFGLKQRKKAQEKWKVPIATIMSCCKLKNLRIPAVGQTPKKKIVWFYTFAHKRV